MSKTKAATMMAAMRLHAANERTIAGKEPEHDFDVSLECNPGWLNMGAEALAIAGEQVDRASAADKARVRRLCELLSECVHGRRDGWTAGQASDWEQRVERELAPELKAVEALNNATRRVQRELSDCKSIRETIGLACDMEGYEGSLLACTLRAIVDRLEAIERANKPSAKTVEAAIAVDEMYDGDCSGLAPLYRLGVRQARDIARAAGEQQEQTADTSGGGK